MGGAPTQEGGKENEKMKNGDKEGRAGNCTNLQGALASVRFKGEECRREVIKHYKATC